MFNQLTNNDSILNHLRADCENCFGLCCVALPYAKSADFAFDKDGGTPCSNLQSDYRCGIHENLRAKGFRGCTVYECFGAGQKVSQITYDGNDWRDNPASAKEMFDVFPIMQQLHEMLCYLNEALNLVDAKPLHRDLQAAFEDTEYLTKQSPKSLLELNVPAHRATVNDLLLRTSELVRAKVSFNKNKNQKKQNKIGRGSDLIGAKLRRADLRGANLRGALFIASDLREADMRVTDLIGADLTGSFFITQAQVNSAKGDMHTKLPLSLSIPDHWR
ncbi:pentapeptide repeat-containing protein [Peribacillus simplex]|uniref:pentapeptide repeat-containing protein n=1 Tax=Peribacillus simplex TaxID=1478 RepID=UPI0024C1F507|nr:pentapeptide repeat-containing protein [Peribacillus simplex]WHX90269.1 pentapeptide repeat-containing protein [Peribacillus simplex]